MSNAYFKFKQFTIYHDRCAMKVGTDGVLLGAWCRVEGARRMLDVGTGSGLIAIQLAQRSKEADIVAVEVEPEAAAQAQENIMHSPWKNRIQIFCTDFRDFRDAQGFDVIVSNPPYFVDALRSPNANRRLARHTEDLNYDLLFRHSKELLSSHGRMAIITPSTVEKLVEDTAWENQMYPSLRTRVYTKPGKPCRRILWEFSHAFTTRCQEDELYIEDGRKGYSDEYKALTHDFYLNI